MSTYNCLRCGAEFTGHKRKFCSPSCCKPKNPIEHKQCPSCNSTFETRLTEKKFCSKKCKERAWSENPKKKKSIKAWVQNKTLLKSIESPKSTKIYINTCKVTGNLFVSRRKNVRYSNQGLALRLQMPYYPSYRWPLSNKVCIECDSSFLGTPKKQYCSKDCSRKHNKRIARTIDKLRERGCQAIIDRVDPIAVFNKYDWHCAICTQPTPRQLLGLMEDSAPSLDHIIPITAGGEHSYHNTQLLCRRCNYAKGTLIDPDKETVQLISIYQQLNKQIHVTEQAIRSPRANGHHR
jgi:5-methylcytosine-specific restriction endonuclease McrA